MFGVRCLLFVVCRCISIVVCCLMLVGRFFGGGIVFVLFVFGRVCVVLCVSCYAFGVVVWVLLLVVGCLLFVAFCSLFVVARCLELVVRCLLFAEC